MSEDVVSFVVERVDDLLKIEKEYLYGVCDQIEQVRNGLRQMQYFLNDADAKKHESDKIHQFVEDTRDFAYHVEDILEISIFKIASSRRRRSGGTRNILLKFASILNEGIAVHKLRSEIETIINNISNISSTSQMLGIVSKSGEGSSSVSSEEQPQSRQSYSQVVDEDFAGSDEDMKILVKMLVNENENCRVVSICGGDGIGKTTLAQKVYNHIDVQRHFDCFAWVCISEQWKRRDILLEILIKLERKQIVNVKREKLKNGLIRIQQEKKCLVVLDDIWSKDTWDDLEPAFPGRGTRTKILLTSPDSGAVALHADPNAFVHQLRLLTKEESWELLRKKTFPSDTVK
ncbi:hypothetical protein F0562_000520 [Nyssa sinensis]|uniref:NB-ARC domain-containing protein n=1 Tax=Nyssa sinensis TaxID=561372 RepID=A0A5J5C1N1_9ASTE|nr:hypothetical protein F0562_000520 [Nyssa sinensis]